MAIATRIGKNRAVLGPRVTPALTSGRALTIFGAPLSRRPRSRLGSRGHHDWPVKPTIRSKDSAHVKCTTLAWGNTSRLPSGVGPKAHTAHFSWVLVRLLAMHRLKACLEASLKSWLQSRLLGPILS